MLGEKGGHMKVVMIICVVLALSFGTLAYFQHKSAQELKMGTLRHNLDGTITIIPDHTAIIERDRAEFGRNLLATGSAVFVVAVIGCLFLLHRKKRLAEKK